MTRRIIVVTAASLIAAIIGHPHGAIAQNGDDLPPARSVDVTSEVEAVTVYPGRAAASRRATLELDAGLYDLRFGNLPATIQPDTTSRSDPSSSARSRHSS